VSTPSFLELPDGVQRTTIRTTRGAFAALEAVPASGVCERDAALLVPGYTGSKEDFIAILDLLADRSRQVVAIDMRGQFETEGAREPGGYAAAALGADILSVMNETGARHLVGHSYGGLIGRETILSEPDAGFASFTLMSSGPGALTGPRAGELRAMLAALGAEAASGDPAPGDPAPSDAAPSDAAPSELAPGDRELPDPDALRAGIADIWRVHLEPQVVAAGVPAPIVAFLGRRMLANDPAGLVLMARHMLAAPDRTAELARLDLPMLVIYGEDDNAWSPAAQEAMAQRLGASRLCIPAAVHSPAVEAPATTASALTQFWDAAEAPPTRHPAAATRIA
jgi:pimeloyl-ACP methyl ester carboxylesterase